jgi:acetyl esterase/lipase
MMNSARGPWSVLPPLLPLLAAAMLSGPAGAQGYSGRGADSIAEETLAQFRPPPLEPAVRRKVQRLIDVRAPGAGLLSPDAKRLYFTWRVTGSAQVWRIDGPERFPVQMTGGDEPTSLVDITPDGRWLVLQRDANGEENPGVYLQSVDGGALIEVLRKPGIQSEYQFTTPDSRYVVFRANDQKPDSYAIYRYEIATGLKQTVFEQPGIWSVADHRPDGRLLLMKATGSLQTELHEWQPAQNQLVPLVGAGEPADYTGQYGAGDGELIVQAPLLGNFRRLYRWRAGTFVPISPDLPWDVSAFSVDPARTRIVYTVNDNGYGTLHALDAHDFHELAVPPFKDADQVVPGASTPDGRYQTLSVETATAPALRYVFDWKTRKLVRWVVPSAPEVDTRFFARATLEYYPARDGTKIPMFVRRPRSCDPAPCPVIVEFHGGPEGQSRPGFSLAAQLFVDAGYIVARPNVRGSDGYGKAWLDADNGARRLDVITDIEDAARFIRANWGAGGKPPKLGVMGGSYGGYATLVAMTMFGGAYDAGVSNVGISNLLTFLQNTAPYRRQLRVNEYGDPEKDRDALIALSPLSYTDRLAGPLLIIQGASDPRVPVGEAIQMFEAARQRGSASRLILFADEGHGAQKRDNIVSTIGHTLQFFDANLK